MQRVGDKLREIALTEISEPSADVFGRSAFNRYYYSSYLSTREMLGLINSSWKYSPHKTIPSILTGSLFKLIKNALKHQVRNGLISDAEAKRWKYEALSSISAMSSVLASSYSTRLDADYYPEKKIRKERNNIYLGNQSIESARRWTEHVLAHRKVITNVCRQLGIF